MPTLDIQLLGDFRLGCDGAPVTSINSPRLQALLAYLVLHRAVPQARQQIAFLFWPDFPETNARNNLRQLLFDLLRALPAADSFLEVAGSMLQWRSDAPFSLDVAEFESALAAAEQAEQNRDQESEQAALEASALLYRGDLLPSCYDDWIVPTRETLRQKSITALERLIELQLQQRDYRKALSHAQHLLRQDPLHEATYRHLMRLHALSGDRAGVVRVYNTCVQVLQRELSVEPSPGTRAEYEHWLKESLSPNRAPDRALPPPATPRRHNLPFQLTNFIGRERESSQVKELIATHRLVTLTGSGGVGKTRLALRVAADVLETFSDGVWLADLAPLSDPALVPQAVATVLEIREAPGSPLLNTLADYVRGKRLLLILDNCEHLGEAVRRLAKALVETAPNLRILATSRESLGIAGEVTWRVPSLSMPEGHPLEERAIPSTSASIMQFESLQLFVDRATAVLPTFTVTDANASEVGKICHQLDGIPLAIELAAARVKMLSPQQIAARLDRCFDLLTVGSRTALPRHQTLRATMDWSYQLLAEGERVLLDRLAVFAGSFSIETVEQVCAEKDESERQIHPSMILDLLSNLIDKSLVVVEQKDTETRYHLLETVRQYARERLVDSGESEKIRSRHLDYFMQFAETVEPKLHRPEQMRWLDRLDVEHDNLRAALEWSLGEGRVEQGLRLAAALWWFWELRGYLGEGRAHLTALLNLAACLGEISARTRALYVAGRLAGQQGDLDIGRQLLEASLVSARVIGDKWTRMVSLHDLGHLHEKQGEFVLAGAFHQESMNIAKELGDNWGMAWAFMGLGHLAFRKSDYATARSFFEESLQLRKQMGDKWGMARSLNELGEVSQLEGDHFSARRFYEASLGIHRELRHQSFECTELLNIGSVIFQQGDYARAAAIFSEGVTLSWKLGKKGELVKSLIRLTQSTAKLGQFEKAARLFGALEDLQETVGMRDRIFVASLDDYDRNVAVVRAQLGEAAFVAAWSEGRAMTLEQAIAYALKDG